jgi:DNA modification methylase/succinate dehydrogenase flavin-adding protein (antitoxin of CptAB toxin-antitoxin module)
MKQELAIAKKELRNVCIDEIKIDLENYPRNKINDKKIGEYSEILDLLPPPQIDSNNFLITGLHTLEAYKRTGQKEIICEIKNINNDIERLILAIESNTKHGIPLTYLEKKNNFLKLFEKVVNGELKDFDAKKLKELFSISDSTVYEWTRNLREELESQQNEKIFDLFLQCKKQQEISDETGFPQTTISAKIREIDKFCELLTENPSLEIPIKYQFLKEKIKFLAGFSPLVYNVWNVHKENEATDFFGSTPEKIMDNLIFLITKRLELIYDPFGGSGTIIDSCKKMLRKYYVSDRKPLEYRPEIKKWDINDGIPDDLPNNINLVFLDPPYWKQAKGQYSQDTEDLGNIELANEFHDKIVAFVKKLKTKIVDDGYIALLIRASSVRENNLIKRINHAFELSKEFEKIGFELVEEIIAPYPTVVYTAFDVNNAKEKKYCLDIARKLLIFKKIKKESK